MKIYTKRGDHGMTDLPEGRRLWKSDLHFDALGELDELNSAIGLVRSALSGPQTDLDEELRSIQNVLVSVSAALCGFSGEGQVDSTLSLENAIDRMDGKLQPHRAFILPGGHPAAADAHMARAVCRRAERRIVALQETISETGEKVDERPLAWLNRLSDYLFVLARYLNKTAGMADDNI